MRPHCVGAPRTWDYDNAWNERVYRQENLSVQELERIRCAKGRGCRQLLVVLGEPRIMLGSTTSKHLEKSLVSILSFLDNIRVIQTIQARPDGGNIVTCANLCGAPLCPRAASCPPSAGPQPPSLPPPSRTAQGLPFLPAKICP